MILKEKYLYKDCLYNKQIKDLLPEDKPYSTRLIYITFVNGKTFKADKMENGVFTKGAYYTDTYIYTENTSRILTEIGLPYDYPEFLL